jgi:DNA-binding SARP family transcriptional activator
LEDAIELLIESREWDELARLVLAHAPSMIRQGRAQTIVAWLDRFPDELLSKTPWLLFWHGVCRMLHSLPDARSSLEKAFELFQEQADLPGTLLSWAAAVDTILFEWDDYTRLDSWIDWMEGYMNRGGLFPSINIEARVASSMTGALAFRRPGHPDTERWVDRTLRLNGETADKDAALNGLANAAFYCFEMDLARFRVVADEIRRMALVTTASPLVSLTWKWVESVGCGLSGQYDETYRSVSEGLALADHTGIHMLDFQFFAYGAQAALVKGDWSSASGFIGKMGALARDNRHGPAAHYYTERALYGLAVGNASDAVSFMRSAVNQYDEMGAAFPQWFTRVTLALALHEAREYDEAHTCFLRARELLRQIPARHTEYGMDLVEAHMLLDCGRKEDALHLLRSAFGGAKNQEHAWSALSYLWRPSILARLCAAALEAGIEVEFVREMIRRNSLTLDPPPLNVENWPWPVKVYTLGRFEIVVEDKPIDFTRLQRKPLSLLKALIALGGEGVREETLSELLWPDAEGDAAYASFRTTLSRLRHSLGENAILIHEGHVSLDPRRVWVDTSAFRRISARAEGRKEDPSSLTGSLTKLYCGDFLPNEDEHWVVSPRAKLRDLFLRLIVALGDELEKESRWDDACASYRAALDVDDLAERLYQRLMVCYSRLGDKAAAISTYTRLRGTLKARLDAEPSARTEAIYRQVITETF